jgi:hypothetical protein
MPLKVQIFKLMHSVAFITLAFYQGSYICKEVSIKQTSMRLSSDTVLYMICTMSISLSQQQKR